MLLVVLLAETVAQACQAVPSRFIPCDIWFATFLPLLLRLCGSFLQLVHPQPVRLELRVVSAVYIWVVCPVATIRLGLSIGAKSRVLWGWLAICGFVSGITLQSEFSSHGSKTKGSKGILLAAVRHWHLDSGHCGGAGVTPDLLSQ